MKVPISWLKDYVKIEMPLDELAHALTMAGLEVEEIEYVGLPLPGGELEARLGVSSRPDVKISGIEWDPLKIVVAAVHEVVPHPNADRLVLCRLDDGEREHIVLTGAPNLYPYKGKGALETPLKVAYAREGARIYDGHKPGQELMTLKRAKIRGVESYSMICSEKELGISDAHEGVIILDDDAPVGTPLVDYMGDAVFDIDITPNIARDANILGVAREVAAITDQPLIQPSYDVQMDGEPIAGKVSIEIRDPRLNPRFVLGMISDVEIGPSPYWVQRRLHLAGMRPINNLVDATNYAMLEIGEPLHAFDYDSLARRAGGKAPTIITRAARQGERLVTLDDEERELDDFTVVVCDTQGPVALAGVMGGAETEINDLTRSVLLEGATWNYINTRRTVNAQRLPSEAAYRFSRGVHPEVAPRGVKRCLELMRRWAGGAVAKGLVDNYPLPRIDPTVEISAMDVRRWLGIELTPAEIADILARLEFDVQVVDQVVRATCPDHRLDIGEGVTGKADLLEEIARIYGYERIPVTRMADELPPQRNNPKLEFEEHVRDILVKLGLQEVVTYRMTSGEREARLMPPGLPADDRPYVKIANPISSDRNVLRHSLVSSVFEILERNARLKDRLTLFEIGPIFLASEDGDLPDEIDRLAIAITGPRAMPGWQDPDHSSMDFYDLKGIINVLMEGLRIKGIRYVPVQVPIFHPGKCARVLLGDRQLGVLGELHPQVSEHYEFGEAPVLVADLDFEALRDAIPAHHPVTRVSAYPPVYEDLAVIVDEDIPAERVEAVIWDAGGEVLSELHLFDVYRGEQIGSGKKSLAYNLIYQSYDYTLNDKQVLKIRNRIVNRLEEVLGAYLRS